MQVKDECEPGFSGVIKVTHRRDLFYANTSDTDTLLCPFGVRIREVQQYIIALIFKFGQCLLVMKNESGDSSQSETAKYFE